jgi:uncharacterized OsmC-like protein
MATNRNIEGLGFPLAFMSKKGSARPGVLGASESSDVFLVEARQLDGHQKEGVVTEGARGSSWRLATDEGGHLRGTDLAPFPLGFFNAGLQADLANRLLTLARQRSLAISDLEIDVHTGYYMTGSFFKGDGTGYAEPAKITVAIGGPSSAAEAEQLVADAVLASPALAAMRIPVQNTFALYLNGQRRTVSTMKPSPAPAAPDPFVTHSRAPEPIADSGALTDLIYKTGRVQEGEISPAPAGTKTKIIRTVTGTSWLIDPTGVTETRTVLGLPGMSEFALRTDEREDHDTGPSGLSLVSAGIAFCYMTQMSRYVEHMKYRIRNVRLVQFSPYALRQTAGGLEGAAEPVDTHLFFEGEEDEETAELFMRIAARTCYLHATLADSLEPIVTVQLL